MTCERRNAEPGLIDGLTASLGGPRTSELLEAGNYHPDQRGSYSIKRVAPLLCGRGYEDLAVSDGMAAVIAWRRGCSVAMNKTDLEQTRADLLAYCGRDTELMHLIVEAVRSLVRAE